MTVPASPYRVEALSYGWVVRWGKDLALVIVEDDVGPIYRCCRCQLSSCPHVAALRDWQS